MGLLTGLIGLPTAPLRGTIRIAEEVMRQAEETYYDPAVIRRQLEDVARMREEGVMSEAEAAWWEEELISRLIEGAQRERH
jgi:hypothetical protein